MITRDIALCAVPHRMTQADGQVIFLNTSGFSHTQFTFEWTGLDWYLVDTESEWERLFVPHIIAAYEWCRRHYAVTYVNGTGTVAYQDEPIINPQ